MPSPKPGRSPASGPHIKINTSSTRFPQRFRRSRCRGVPRGQDPVFIRAPRSPAGPGRRGKAGFGQAGADRSGFKRPGSSPQYIAGRTASAWPAPRLHRGGAGPGAPATVGRHLPCVSEFICGDIQPVSGARFATAVTGRLLPLGAVIGHDHAEGSVTDEPVENGDFTAFPVQFERGLGPWGVSRVASGRPNGLVFRAHCGNGAAKFDQHCPAEIQLCLHGDGAEAKGAAPWSLARAGLLLVAGLPWTPPGSGFGRNGTFGHQARAFAGEVAGPSEGESQPCCAAFAEGARHGDYRCGHRGVRVAVAGSQAVSAQDCLPVFDGALHHGKAALRFH
jgi:hypothetical protein